MLRYLTLVGCLWLAGCSLLPTPTHQPSVHNPFPQLSKVAVAPFFNLSAEPTLDGRQVAIAYFNELQLVPGFEVVPVGVVEKAMQENKIALGGPADARRLAQLLEVDAVVIGAVTDYFPYYPPRCGLQVEWYAANPCFHPIPPGYGLPWGTREEQDIPGPLVFEAEFALAKAQLNTQTPVSDQPDAASPAAPAPPGAKRTQRAPEGSGSGSPDAVQPMRHDAPAGAIAASDTAGLSGPAVPPGWPDPRGFIPPPPSPRPPTCWPSEGPVMRHARTYNGHDADFTTALASYHQFRDDARFDGWQGYLQRSEDFIRFCCHKHIWEMLTARGGAGETRVVWQWPIIR